MGSLGIVRGVVYTRTPGIVPQFHRSQIGFGLGYMGILQNLQKFRVRYGIVTELTKIPGIVARAYRTRLRQKHYTPVPRVFVALAYKTSSGSSGYGYECHAELPEGPGTGMNALQNLQKFFVG